MWTSAIRFLMSAVLVILVGGCSGLPPRVAPEGTATAGALNARYADIRPDCDGGNAAYFCSGVLYRAILRSPSYYFWNNAHPQDYDGVSFSFLRRDMGVRDSYLAAGYIFAPADTWNVEGAVSLQMFCSYAFDGMTGSSRGIHGCGKAPKSDGSEPCADQGIATVPVFARHYSSVTGSTYERWAHQCSFGVDWKAFHTSVLARQSGYLEPTQSRYSEQVISNWPDGNPDHLPLEALYVVAEALSTGLPSARSMQQDFFNATGRVLPIVRMSMDAAQQPFSYHPEDQAPSDPRRAVSPRAGGAPVSFH